MKKLHSFGPPCLSRGESFRLVQATLAAIALSMVAACGGGGGGGDSSGGRTDQSTTEAGTNQPVAPTGPITLTGQATFAYVPSKGGQLVYAQTQRRPIRGVPAEILDSDGRVLASTTTDAQGRYRFTLPSDQMVRLRLRAQIDAGGLPIQVIDNTQLDTPYALESPPLTASVGTANLHADSGWTGSRYGNHRAAAPFAILDTVYRAQATVLAVDPQALFKPLTIHWSPLNKPSDGDPKFGDITGSHFEHKDDTGHIYLLGAEGVDTDEYDESVVAHEWGHYYQWTFSRDDSIGGPHGGEPLEITMAFSEGWGHGIAAIATGRQDISNSYGPRQQRVALDFALPTSGNTAPGWFNELSVGSVFQQLHQSTGFAPIHAAMKALVTTPAFTSIHAFADVARKGNPVAADALDSLLAAQSIATSRQLGDAFGTGETNSGGLVIPAALNPSIPALPIYHALALDTPIKACSVAQFGEFNKLGNHQFFRFNAATATTYRLTVSGLKRIDQTDAMPAISVLFQGERQWSFNGKTVFTYDLQLPDGDTALSVADIGVLVGGEPSGCIDVVINLAPTR